MAFMVLLFMVNIKDVTFQFSATFHVLNQLN